MIKRPVNTDDMEKYMSLTKASIYMVADQMPNKEAYIKDVMGSSEYVADNYVLISMEEYERLDEKYAPKNKLRKETKTTSSPAIKRRCSGCSRKRKKP